MKRIAAAVAVAGCVTAWPACAGQAVGEAMRQARLGLGNEASDNENLAGLPDTYPASREVLSTSRQLDSTRNEGVRGFVLRTSGADRGGLQGVTASYNFPANGGSSVFGYIGLPGEPALGPPVSDMRRISGIDSPETAHAGNWLDSSGHGSRVFTVGYAWRALKLEGSAFSGSAQDDRKQPEKDMFRLDSTSTRLSYNPSPDWSLQLSRGTLSGLDQLEPEAEVRRATISATYNRALSGGNWQSTLAWGRSTRKSREPTMGYLLESTLHFSGADAVFGRLEQVGSDELVSEKGSAQNQVFKLNRLSLGYFHEIGSHGPVMLDAGAFISRYFVPSSASTTYGSEPTSFMLFLRLNIR